MTKIYDALMNVSREREDAVPTRSLPLFNEGEFAAVCLDLEEEMLTLFQAIESLLPQSPRKILQFIGSRKGEGASTIAREFSRLAAFKIGLSVLLLDADRFNSSIQHFFGIRACDGWHDAIRNQEHLEEKLHRIKDSNLFVSPSSNSYAFTPEMFNTQSTQLFWNSLKSRFDLVVIDSAPLSTSPDGLAIAPNVDGIVLIVEAEKTKWKVADEVKKRLTQVGGNVIGLVLNKRRQHVPKLLEDWI